ncbi:MAG TPA: protein kinase, partial [Gemmatimonadaceae bacterium]|nr:protein kinase [Gemmatimonadaceae bacterium]
MHRESPGATPRPSNDGQTLLTAATHSRRLQVFRHEVEMLATRAAADCDRMLRLAHQPDRSAWRDAIGQALLSARLVASRCQVSVPADEQQAERRLDELEQATREGLQRIVEAMGTILHHVPVSLDDDLLAADARSVRGLAMTALSISSRGASGARPSGAAELAAGAITPNPAAGIAAPDALAGLPPRVICADDSPEIRKMMSRILSRLGYEVLTAEHGRQALDLARATPPDLVLTDIDMPEMDGIELLKAIKADAALAHLPVIVISSDAATARVAESLDLGADDHLGKPFQARVLEARVRSSLQRKRMRDAELDHVRRASMIAAAAEAADRDAYVAGSLAGIARGNDQLAHLARVFDRLVTHLKTREDRLHRRLRQLRAEMGDVTSAGVKAARQNAESPFEAGQVLAGRYEIIHQVGRGGMGVVYHASDLELHEDVAIKVVRPDVIADDPALVGRLKSEIRLSRKLSHPNILRAHDIGEHGGMYFISMEYVRGVSLLDMLDQTGRISVEAVLAVGTQLADALGAAHAAGIIHRDIKPANMLMDEQGALKVMDFGLAKAIRQEHGQTQGGVAVGTPQYMAPEQLMGGALDGRSDLFAAGIVLYECLTGRPPFVADSPVALVAQMIDGGYPALDTLVPDVPPPLAAIIGRLLELQPEGRVQTAQEL